ncbi:MAG: acetoin utilization protein AcuC [Rhodospirillaceae bacterium]|nr:acetoin utilization protein AcuC [Rhodospirillaceae bacterium]|tara:strand:+ start:1172 stop:2296 length:1125 start_codon:yes stop_codon:yes gene_type:complete
MTSNLFPEHPLMIGNEIYRFSRFGAHHPLSIERITPVIDLCYSLGWVDDPVYLESRMATQEMLCRYHDHEYVEAVFQAEQNGLVDQIISERFNLGINGNPIFPEIFTRPAITAGASIQAGELLAGVDNGVIYSVAGGTHHAKKAMASGFCFFNDLVLGILALLDGGIEKVLYVDLDAHHGDGVQDAFSNDERVLTVSIHEKGRWPGTGDVLDRANGAARNLPVPSGFNDTEMDLIVRRAIIPLGETFGPQAIVIQCGCDNLADDPQSKLQLSNIALWGAVDNLIKLAPRALIVGGGGYNPWSAARAWTGIWGIINNKDVDINLPLEAMGILKALTWNHSWGRSPPFHWYSSLADFPNEGIIREEIKDIISEVLK